MLARTFSGSLTTSNPSTLADPEVGKITVESILSKVVLPAPFTPKIPVIAPGRAEIVTPATAKTGPRLVSKKVLEILEVWTTAHFTREGSGQRDRYRLPALDHQRFLELQVHKSVFV